MTSEAPLSMKPHHFESAIFLTTESVPILPKLGFHA